jgi:hypothetical protein
MAESHYCQKHNCKFLLHEKNGKSWYSHRIEETGKWCNEPNGANPIPEENFNNREEKQATEHPHNSNNESIERQVAVKEIMATFREGLLVRTDNLVLASLKWCGKQLGIDGEEVEIAQEYIYHKVKGESKGDNVESSNQQGDSSSTQKGQEDRQENQGTGSGKNETDRELIKSAFIENLKEHNKYPGWAVATLNHLPSGKYKLESIDDINDFDEAYKDLKVKEKWES